MSKWLPIDTAPKSEFCGQILTFRNYDGTEESFQAKCGHRGHWFQTSFYSTTFDLWAGWPISVQPTHWMPLPAPPQASVTAIENM